MPSDTIDLVTCTLTWHRRGGLLGAHPLAPLAGHLLHSVLIQLELLSKVVVGSMQPQQGETHSPHAQRLMRPSKDGVGHSVEAAATGRASITLTCRLRVVAPWFGDLGAFTAWTVDAVWPAQRPDSLKAFGVIEE